jgi:hypothetical protein
MSRKITLRSIALFVDFITLVQLLKNEQKKISIKLPSASLEKVLYFLLKEIGDTKVVLYIEKWALKDFLLFLVLLFHYYYQKQFV